MIELAVLVAAFVALGAVRPRWTTLLAALVPGALAFVWLLLNEDTPDGGIGFADAAWFAGMSLVVAAVYACACLGGLVLGRALRRARARPPA